MVHALAMVFVWSSILKVILNRVRRPTTGHIMGRVTLRRGRGRKRDGEGRKKRAVRVCLGVVFVFGLVQFGRFGLVRSARLGSARLGSASDIFRSPAGRTCSVVSRRMRGAVATGLE